MQIIRVLLTYINVFLNILTIEQPDINIFGYIKATNVQ